MANSIKTYVWNSSTHSNTSDFIAPTPLSGRGSTDIKVKVGSTILTSGYTLTVDSSNVAKVRFQALPNNGDPIRIYRETKHDGRLVDFVDGSLLTSETLDLDSNQIFNMAQEAYDKGEETTIGRESFYYSQGTDPTDDDANIVNTGALWYDTSSSTNTLQVWSGTEWQATAPAKVKKTYQRVTTNGFIQVANNAHSSGKTKFADTAFKTHSSLYLNGVKLVEASTLANIPSKGDYFLSGGDVILLNLSSDTDVLVSETFDGSFSSSVTASEANALDYKNQAGQSSTGAAQSATSASDFKDEAEDEKNDAAKYASHPKNSSFSTHDDTATGQYSAKHYAETAEDSAATATGSTGAGNSKLQTVGTDLQLGNNSKIKKVSDGITAVGDVAGIINDVTSVSNLGDELETIVNKYDGTTNASGDNKNIKQIDTVADNIGDVNTVAADTSKIDTIATDLGNGASSFIKKVSDGMASVTTVAGYVGSALANGITWLSSTTNQNTLGAVEGKIAEIDAVEAKLPQIDTVAGVADEVAVVGESVYKGNVQTVANTDYKAKVTTVASMQDDVNTVASASSDIDTITTGANLSNIGTVVSNISAVQGASANAATASTGASTATTKANEASVSEANAETYMNTASGHATTAGTHKTAAQSAQAAAQAAQSIAEGASTSASSSKTQAAASENNAATSAASAQNSASSATASENQAEVYMNASNDWDSFYQKRYLGDASSNPSVDTAGNALQNGALYFNTSDNTMYVYNGSTWVAAESTINNVNWGGQLSGHLNTNNYDIRFGDDDKALFGAGSDLKIYHSANNQSYIHEVGSGDLNILATNLKLQDANGSTKAEVKSTGMKVLGDLEQSTGDLKYTGAINWDIAHHGAGQNIVFSTTPSGGSATQRMRITSTGNVGIGTTSPATALDISQSNARGAYLRSSTTGSRMHFLDATTSSVTTVGIGAEGNNLVLHGGGSEFMRVASSGRVGIGTTNPSHKLDISGGHLRLDDAYRIRFGGGTAAIEGNGSSNILSLITNNTERVRIDASGNLLVGTTDSSPVGNNDSDGIALLANGSGQFSRDGGTALLVNRKTSDGELLRFNKDSTSVGSISTVNGDMYLGTANVNLRFTDSANDIRPVNSSGVNLDNTVDLGASATRFKDLYLSGGVHLGGTGSANKLDDYEEGTFTLNTASDSSGAFQDTPTCLYTKIGNTVNVFIAFRVGANFASYVVGGLPFATSHTGMNSAFISGGIAITGNNNTVSVTVGNNGTTIRFHDNQNTSDAHLPNTTDEYYRLNFTYKTA